MSDNLHFAAKEFHKNARVSVTQGQNKLADYDIGQLIVNDIMVLNGDWQRRVDPAGPAIRIQLAH